MIARLAGVGLGLLAFSVTVVAGLAVGNPVDVILSRSIFALFLFCLVGILLGAAAEAVVAEREKDRAAQIRKRYRQDAASPAAEGADGEAPGQEAPSIGT